VYAIKILIKTIQKLIKMSEVDESDAIFSQMLKKTPPISTFVHAPKAKKNKRYACIQPHFKILPLSNTFREARVKIKNKHILSYETHLTSCAQLEVDFGLY